MSSGLSLLDGFDRSGLSHWSLWLQYASVGGVAEQLELEAYVLGLMSPDPHEYTVIAQALNEYFVARGEDHPVAYSQQEAEAEH